jgi:hypothetical protein
MIKLPIEDLHMTATDVTLLNDVLAEKRKLAPDLPDDEFFELFASQQVLRDFRLDPDDIQSGIVRGSGDGGVDSIYLLVNGRLIRDLSAAEDLKNLRQNVTIDLIIIQATREASFSLDRVNRLKTTAEDILTLDRRPEDFGEDYNEDLRDAIERFRLAHKLLLTKYPTLNVSFFYVSKGDREKILNIENDVKRRASALEVGAKGMLATVSNCTFTFVGARELIELATRPPKTVFSLPCADAMPSEKGGYAAFVKLTDFYAFITAEDGQLRDHLFESNVRDYQGDVAVNEGIRTTLKQDKADDFWWLNNGITILASKIGGDLKNLVIEEPQIVNGLQTSQEIYEYFRTNKEELKTDTRQTLIRIIASTDVETQDKIIRATNSQTSIPPASLWATDPIHRAIERRFQHIGLYYDRRKSQWRKEGIPIAKIVGITELAQSVAAIGLQEPDHARARPGRYFKRDKQGEKLYKAIFDLKRYPIDFYSCCAALRKEAEKFLRKSVVEREHRSNMLFYLLMVVVCLKTKSSRPQPKRIATIDLSTIDDALSSEALNIVYPIYMKLGGTNTVAKGTQLVQQVKAEMERRFPKRKAKKARA